MSRYFLDKHGPHECCTGQPAVHPIGWAQPPQRGLDRRGIDSVDRYRSIQGQAPGVSPGRPLLSSRRLSRKRTDSRSPSVTCGSLCPGQRARQGFRYLRWCPVALLCQLVELLVVTRPNGRRSQVIAFMVPTDSSLTEWLLIKTRRRIPMQSQSAGL